MENYTVVLITLGWSLIPLWALILTELIFKIRELLFKDRSYKFNRYTKGQIKPISKYIEGEK